MSLKPTSKTIAPPSSLAPLLEERTKIIEADNYATKQALAATKSLNGLSGGHDKAFWQSEVKKLGTDFGTVEKDIENVAVSQYKAATAYVDHLQSGAAWARSELATATGKHDPAAMQAWSQVTANEEKWLKGAQGAKTNALNQAAEQMWTLGPQKDVAALTADIAASAHTQPFAGGELPNGGVYKPVANATLWGDGLVRGNMSPDLKTKQLVGPDVRANDPRNPSGLGAIVRQGASGDCVFDATLTGLLAKNPKSAHDMIRPDPKGGANSYQVRFFLKDPATHALHPEWVSVDSQVPIDSSGKPAFNKIPLDGANHPIIAAALIEKAFVKFKDEHHLAATSGAGYFGAGLNATQIMECLTGKQAHGLGYTEAVSVSTTGRGPLMAYDPQVVAGVLGMANGPHGQPVTAGIGQQGQQDALGGRLTNHHEYTVLGTVIKGGEVMVNLRNPWGAEVAGKLGSNTDGVICVRLRSFRSLTGNSARYRVHVPSTNLVEN
jgi:hypothetical protein